RLYRLDDVAFAECHNHEISGYFPSSVGASQHAPRPPDPVAPLLAASLNGKIWLTKDRRHFLSTHSFLDQRIRGRGDGRPGPGERPPRRPSHEGRGSGERHEQHDTCTSSHVE